MNIPVKPWVHISLDEIFTNDISIKLLAKYNNLFEMYKKSSTNCIEIHPLKMNKIIPFNKKKKDWFHFYGMLSNNIIRCVLVSLFAFIFMNMLNISFSNAEKPTASYLNIQVSSGDTVWTIASKYSSDKDDLRELVYAIKTLNGLNNNANIYSGQTLRVPAPTN